MVKDGLIARVEQEDGMNDRTLVVKPSGLPESHAPLAPER